MHNSRRKSQSRNSDDAFVGCLTYVLSKRFSIIFFGLVWLAFGLAFAVFQVFITRDYRELLRNGVASSAIVKEIYMRGPAQDFNDSYNCIILYKVPENNGQYRAYEESVAIPDDKYSDTKIGGTIPIVYSQLKPKIVQYAETPYHDTNAGVIGLGLILVGAVMVWGPRMSAFFAKLRERLRSKEIRK